MVEVSRHNFLELAPTIISAIKNADFISLDMEYTGLNWQSSSDYSLFDAPEDRYEKLCINVPNYTVAQIGLATFKRNDVTKQYSAQAYNIFLCPRSLGQFERPFACQPSSLDFLCQHDFDFNKFIYDGVSFLNNVEEAKVKEILETDQLCSKYKRDLDESLLQEECSNIAQWLASAQFGDVYTIQLKHIHELFLYALQQDLRSLHKDIWTTPNRDGIAVTKITYEERKNYETLQHKQEDKRIYEHMLGFTRIFRELVQSRKVVVGHNLLTDLVHLHHKFYEPLPNSWAKFKYNLSALLPEVYDTKHIAHKVRVEHPELAHRVEHTALGNLYANLTNPEYHNPCTPYVELTTECSRYNTLGRAHEAGYDAYMCGCVFLHIAYLIQSLGDEEDQDYSFYELLHALSGYSNRCNLIRAAVDYVQLKSLDPISKRPARLVISTRAGTTLPLDQLRDILCTYGNADLKTLSKTHAVIAVSTNKCARDVKKDFTRHNEFRIVQYNLLTHSSSLRNIMWFGFIVSGSVSLVALLSGVRISTTS